MSTSTQTFERMFASKDLLSDKIFFDLYENRVLEENPYYSLDDSYDAALNGELIGLTFGSTSYDFLPKHSVMYAENIFLHGYCTLFAYRYAEITGVKDFYLISRKNESFWSGHLAVIDQGRLIDVRGEVSQEKLEHEYPISMFNHERISYNDLMNTLTVFSSDYTNDPLSFLDDLERRVTEFVVEQVAIKMGH